MKAVLMAGGGGSRLRPLTSRRPKPLAPVAGKPIMELILELLRQHGFTDVVATLHYLADEIEAYFGDGSAHGVAMHYVVEDTPLGTAGAVKMAHDLLIGETFLVISGDALTNLDLSAVVRHHREQGKEVTIALPRAPTPPGSPWAPPTSRGASCAFWRNRRGARSSPTRSTPGSTCSNRRSSTGCSAERSTISPKTSSPTCCARGRTWAGTSSTGTGPTSEPSSSTNRPTTTRSPARSVSTFRARRSHRASSPARVVGSTPKRGSRDPW